MRISVIIATYNCAGFVASAIRSVLSQSHQVHELIVVDDGSTDSTAAVVREFGEKALYVRTENRGAAAARNTGLARATGECIAFLDADDEWYPRKLELQVRLLETHPAVQAVCCDFDLVDQAGALVRTRFVKGKYRVFREYAIDWPDVFSTRETLTVDDDRVGAYFGDVFRVLFLGNFINTSSMLVRRHALVAAGCFTAGRLTQEDYELWLKLALRGPIAYIDWPMLLFRRRPNQLTSDDQKLRVAQDVADVVLGFADAARQRLGKRLAARRLSDVQRHLALALLGIRQPAAARRALGHACARGGLNLGAVLLYCWSWIPARVTDGLRHLFRRAWRRPDPSA